MNMQLPERHILSKSTFMIGCQCPKRLWLHKFRSGERDEQSEEQTAIFQAGTNVGLLARQLFPNGVDASPETPYKYQQSVADTARLISMGTNVIYEAAFQFDGILAAIDILVQKDGKWYAFEVKGSNSVKSTYVQDAALQYYVIMNAGLVLEEISIVHLNRDFIRQGELDIQQLFCCTSVKQEVQALQPLIEKKAKELKLLLQSRQPPEISMGNQCNSPYACDFQGFCSRGIEKKTVDVVEEEYINREAIQQFLKGLEYPLQFLDFETWMAAIPEQDGHWPFRQVPFQFSLHIQQSADSEAEHKYYLAEGPHISHHEFAERLLECIPKEGSVLVYNKTFENMILEQLKNELEHLSVDIENLQARMVDLMPVFRTHYRLPEMQGSYSLKKVLPAVLPAMKYDELEIGDGSDASSAFYNMKHVQDEQEKQATRRALLDYCELDTLAMVRILELLFRSL